MKKKSTNQTIGCHGKTSFTSGNEQNRWEKLQKNVTFSIIQDGIYIIIANGVVCSAGKFLSNGNCIEEHSLVEPNWYIVIQAFNNIYNNNYSKFESMGKYLSRSSISRTFYDAVDRKEINKFDF